jgi:hypothetical protein
VNTDIFSEVVLVLFQIQVDQLLLIIIVPIPQLSLLVHLDVQNATIMMALFHARLLKTVTLSIVVEVWLNVAILAQLARVSTVKYAQVVLDRLPLSVDNASNVLTLMLLSVQITTLSLQNVVRDM